MSRYPLEGIRVLNLGRWWAGNHAAWLLGAMGAEVIKIEGPRRPDARDGYMGNNNPGQRPYNRVARFNFSLPLHNELGMSLDLESPQGKELFRRLAALSDVLIENFTPRVMPNLGLDYAALRQVNPSLVMVSLPAYGLTGPRREWLGFGTTLDGYGGLVDLTGYIGGPPHRMPIAYVDPVGAIFAVFGVMAALRQRRATGRGQHIDAAQSETVPHLVADAIMEYSMNGCQPPRMGNRHPWMAPHGVYRCRGHDKWVAIACRDDEDWGRLCQALGNPPWCQDGRFRTALGRWKDQDEIDGHLGEWTRERGHREVMRHLQGAGVPAGAVLNIKEVLTDPHVKARGFYTPVFHPETGYHPLRRVGWQMSETPLFPLRHTPCFGEHNDYVYKELLRLSDEEVEELERNKVTSRAPLLEGTWEFIDPERFVRIGVFSEHDPSYRRDLSAFYGVPIGEDQEGEPS